MLIKLLKENHLIGYVHPLVDLANVGHIVQSEIINIRSCVTKKEIPIYFISLKGKENNKEIYEFKYLCN